MTSDRPAAIDPAAPDPAAPDPGPLPASDRTPEPEAGPESETRSSRGLSSKWFLIIGLAIVGNILAFVLVPPFPRGEPGGECPYPVCYINSTLEFPNPHVVLDLSPDTAPEGLPLIQFHPSITASILTMWIISILLIVGLIALTRRRDAIPGSAQNAMEALYDGLQSFAMSLGGPAAKKYVPLFVTLFIYIIVSNWSGLLPFVGRIHEFRAPTSDVNITIGLALVSFAIFHIEGVRALGVGGYLSKFFPVGEFRNGIGAGIIAMFVGLIELMLEFVKPLTLSMRLFGNVYGGEVALGVIIALTIAFIPVALFGLEVMLNAVQALIFSVLTLMFILAAIEGHHGDDEHHQDEPVATPVGTDELTEHANPNPSPAH